jgi:hypothetical protein
MLDHQTTEAILYGVIIILAALAWSRGCRCGKCAFHINERRMADLRQQEEQHDYAHRMWDDCGTKACPRNGERKRKLDQ